MTSHWAENLRCLPGSLPQWGNGCGHWSQGRQTALIGFTWQVFSNAQWFWRGFKVLDPPSLTQACQSEYLTPGAQVWTCLAGSLAPLGESSVWGWRKVTVGQVPPISLGPEGHVACSNWLPSEDGPKCRTADSKRQTKRERKPFVFPYFPGVEPNKSMSLLRLKLGFYTWN